MTGPAGGPEQISLVDGGGTTTTRLVKFNHPADGGDSSARWLARLCPDCRRRWRKSE
jgi:hypothetical protein